MTDFTATTSPAIFETNGSTNTWRVSNVGIQGEVGDLPTQTGNGGAVLGTNGTATSWARSFTSPDGGTWISTYDGGGGVDWDGAGGAYAYADVDSVEGAFITASDGVSESAMVKAKPDGTIDLTATGAATLNSHALVVDTDARLTDARTPTAHKSSHATGGSDALSPSDIGAAAVSNLSGQIVPGAGFYVQTPIYASATLSAFALTEAWQFFTPIFVVRTLTIDRLGLSVSNAGSAGSVIRLGIYANSSSDNPGTLLQDASTVDSTTPGDKLAVVSQTLSPGIYWLSCALQGGATTKAQVYGGFFNVSGWTATISTNACHVYRRLTGGVTGALGSNPSAGSLDSAGSGPRLVARVA